MTRRNRKESVLRELIKARQKILGAIAPLPEEYWDKVFLGKWTLKEFVAHLIGWDTWGLRATREILCGELPSYYSYYDNDDWEKINDIFVRRYRRDSKNELLNEVKKSHTKLVSELRKVPTPLYNHDFGLCWKGAKVTLASDTLSQAWDEEKHFEQIRKWLKSEKMPLKFTKTKKLFLASVTPFVMKRFLEFLLDAPNKLTMGFVATAADPYKDKWFIEEDRKKFTQVGFKLKEIDLKGRNYQQLMEEFEGVDIIYVAGGNMFYLLEKTRKSDFDKVIKKLISKGIIYAGSSAGAALVCPTIEYVKYFDDPAKAPNLRSFKGLGLVDFLILPHVGEKDFNERYKVYEKHKGKYEDQYKTIKLTNYQAIVVEGDNYQLVEENA